MTPREKIADIVKSFQKWSCPKHSSQRTMGLFANISTITAYDHSFLCFRRFATLYQINNDIVYNLPFVNEDITVYFIAHCFHSRRTLYSTAKTTSARCTGNIGHLLSKHEMTA